MIRIIYGCFFSEDTFSHLTWWWYGGLRAPLSHALEASQRQIWEFSTRTLNLFDSTPLDCGSFQWVHINQKLKMRSYFEIFHAHSENLLDFGRSDSSVWNLKDAFLKLFMPGGSLNFSDVTPLAEIGGLPKKGP